MKTTQKIFLSFLTAAPFLSAIVLQSAILALLALPLSIFLLVAYDKLETYGFRYITVNYRRKRVKAIRELKIFKPLFSIAPMLNYLLLLCCNTPNHTLSHKFVHPKA